MSTKHTPTPWGIEETTNTLYVGPLRRDGSGKIAEIVYSEVLFGISDEAHARHMANAEAICAAMNGERTETEITEAQAVAFLVQRAKEIKAKFGKDGYANVQISVLDYGADCGKTPPTITVSISAKCLHRNYSGSTFAEAMQKAEPQTPEKQAAEKRAEAARLLAEADKLAPKSEQ